MRAHRRPPRCWCSRGRGLVSEGRLDVVDATGLHYRCYGCKQELPAADFAPGMAKRGSGNRICRLCKNKGERERVARSPNRDRRRTLRLYGLSLEGFEAMKVAQEGLCALCGEPPRVQVSGKSALEVDHDKRTGRVRGLLCKRCNVLLGMVDDDPDRLARITATALAYLGADHDWRVGVKP